MANDKIKIIPTPSSFTLMYCTNDNAQKDGYLKPAVSALMTIFKKKEEKSRKKVHLSGPSE